MGETAEAIVDFVPPALTIDSVDIATEDYDALLNITIHVTNWVNHNTPIFKYIIGDTTFEHIGMIIHSTEKFNEYVDIITLKIFNNNADVLHISVDGVKHDVRISDYIKIDKCEDIYPNVGIWVLL